MPSKEVISQLAPTGTLRAGINMSNFLLVTGKTPSGDPDGVSPDLAREIAKRLGVPVKLVPFPSPDKLVDAAGSNAWDIGLVGAEPQRELKMGFTAAYAEIEATYMVRKDSPLKSCAEADREGVSIITRGGSAYGLWLERNIKNAKLVLTETGEQAKERFAGENIDAFAGLRNGLMKDVEKNPGMRILSGQFSSVQQAVGTLKENEAAVAYLREVVEDAKASGLIARFIEKHKANGLTVAPAG
ncbi:MAG: transporter substrate-binding domain-containing protein [Alphaproteobacteria bacterium]|nr:transporter substrate-binding domain-containing protein [Alphaproteobacteria bacterium]